MPAPVRVVVEIFGFASLDLDTFGMPWRCVGIGSGTGGDGSGEVTQKV